MYARVRLARLIFVVISLANLVGSDPDFVRDTRLNHVVNASRARLEALLKESYTHGSYA
jgi:hypothetical protein